MWVFGYGSLIWKVDFPFERKLVGCIKGYVRRFYQKSTDHRGVPDRPGRVVTLLPSKNPNDEVWGVAYMISPENIDKVVSHLDYREKGGYERKTVLFYPHNSDNSDTNNLNISAIQNSSAESPFSLTIYIGSPGNPNFAGEEDIDTIARHILVSRGPSGPNIEYLYNLATAMRNIASGINDEHLFALEAAVKKLEAEKDGLDTD